METIYSKEDRHEKRYYNLKSLFIKVNLTLKEKSKLNLEHQNVADSKTFLS